MSRPKLRDNSSDVSLFPFLAVLLCTMGSLLLVLVVMAKVSREQAARRAEAEAEAQQALAGAPDDGRAHEMLQLLNSRQELLDNRKQEAAVLLRGEQLRLSHIEDHMRRLQDQLQSLQLAAAELAAMEQGHSDDRLQAEREVARLQRLIDETRQDIAELNEEFGGPRSYSIVPYRGPNGTQRPAIYVECRKNEVVLQPEGLRLIRQDFAPPLGAGNPLASALRSAREFMIRQDPSLGKSADTEPYPLILVRPDGVEMYYRVRAAVESWDSDFGYELINGEMELEYPDANPELAALEHRAIELARARQRMLAAAAPRAYSMAGGAGGSFSGNGGDGFGDEDDFGDGFGNGLDDESGGDFTASGPFGGQLPGDFGSADGDTDIERADPGNPNAFSAGEGQFPGEGGPSGSLPLATEYGGGDRRGPGADSATSPIGGPQLAAGDHSPSADYDTQGNPVQQQAGSFERLGSLPSWSRPTDDGAADGTQTEGQPNGPQGPGATGQMANDDSAAGAAMGGDGRSSSAGMAGSGPASISLGSKANDGSAGGVNGPRFGPERPNDVPIRRTVHVIVRRDRLSILPDRDESPKTGITITGGKEIPLQGATRFAVDDFVSALREHVRGWGIAGSGLYWRPVLVLNVGPDGRQRAYDLADLLKNSGIDIRSTATAQRSDQDNSNATR